MMITLFVETGIQYVDLEPAFDFSDADAAKPCGFHITADGRVWPLPGSELDDTLIVLADDQAVATELDVRYTAIDALEIFARRWIPVPYQTNNPYWVRLFLEPSMGAQGATEYQGVLAADTHSRPGQRDDGRGLCRARRDGNAGEVRRNEIGYPFSVNSEMEQFWAHPEVGQAIDAAWRDWLHRSHPQIDPTDETVTLEYRPAAAKAKLWALMRYLAGKLPQIKLDIGAQNATIDAHLVIDLGNCRTCGLIMETADGQDPLFASLAIRSHELPCRVDREPFGSHMQFVRSNQLPDRFAGISLIRLGDEALEATRSSPVAGALTGMSSPKRYLWDNELRPTDWCFAGQDGQQGPRPIEGDILRDIAMEDPFRKPPSRLLPRPPNPRYSRKTGLVFFLAELMEQAFSQMNSVAHRQQMRSDRISRRRVFRNLVLVHPSGMTPLERKELENGARRAIDIWFDAYRDPVGFHDGSAELLPELPIQRKPDLHLNCDEASAVQLCYLYGEIESRYRGDARRFFDVNGRSREGRKTLRLASLDVGGGTTDLVISEFAPVPGAIGYTCLEHRPLFRDGITLGGDDVVRNVLTDVISRELARQLDIPEDMWRLAFSPTPGEIPQDWESVRRQLVNQLWIPIARHFWALSERQGAEERVTVRQMLKNTSYSADLIKRLNSYLGEISGRQVDVTTVEIRLSPDEFNAVIRRVFSTLLFNFCDIIGQFDCDAMLVAGRPAGLPELLKMLTEYCPLPPGRISSLQGHPVEASWFPFARGGVVPDAKACVVVGAAIHFLATQIGGRFVVRPRSDWPTNVIIGVAQPQLQQVPADHVLFHPLAPAQITGPILFPGHLWLGCRNIDDESAHANAIYEIRWGPTIDAHIRAGRLAAPQVTLRLACRPNDPYSLSIHSVTAPRGEPITREHIQVRFHSSYVDDYWLDTGCFYV